MMRAVLIVLAVIAVGRPATVILHVITGPDAAVSFVQRQMVRTKFAAKQAAFYREVFGWRSGPGGTLTVPVSGSVLAGALRQDPAGKIIYIGVDDVAGCLAQVEAHGGRIVQPRFEVKGVVVLGLFTDPAGNGMGLVEMQAGKPKIP